MIDKIKKLRAETSVSIIECEKALKEAEGDMEKAKEILKEWGKNFAEQKKDRITSQGIIDSYIHPNKKVGVLLELNCETDFVSKAQYFHDLAHEVCLQIAGMGDTETPLLEQPWIKDPSRTIKDLVQEQISKTGENIIVKRYIRYQL
ncbi:MAG: translation elongation factor Ts [Candidatus Nealsonbacteria bacterium]